MKHSILIRFFVAILLTAGPLAGMAAAHNHDHNGHDHNGCDHPDLEIEVHHGQLELHGHRIAHHHDFYQFVDVNGGDWVTQHEGTTWPGIGADHNTLTPNSTVDLVITGGLMYWDGASAAGFEPASGGTHMTLRANALSDLYYIYGDSDEQVLEDFIEVGGGGGIHIHPIWQLFGNSDPADGAYYIDLRVEADGFDPSNVQGVMFHKGMSHHDYDAAIHLMQHEHNDHHHHPPIPEPTGLALLGLGLAPLLKKRRR